jgi:two-component system sensor histidine kinase RegB
LNPFAVLLLAPVVVSAAILRRRQTFMLIALVTGCVTFLAFFNFPLPWDALDMRRSGLYVDGLWMAMVLATVFIGIYAWWVASRARRLDEALAETRFILAKEQEAVALGTLATAAAHRLGSPLNTISVIGHELSRETAPDDPIYEDVVLLCAEIERCRVILSELDDYRNAEPIDVENNIPLSVLIDEIHNTRLDVGNIRFKVIFDERSAMPIPFASRRPEIIQALEDLLRNAGEFAKSEVLITIRCTVDDVLITISDDGPGFSLGVLAKIGTPWNSSRLGTDAHRGLGIFIASTLIETLGGSILYGNGTNGGGEVNLKLPLEILRP